MLSIIVKNSTIPVWIHKILDPELAQIDHEIIFTRNWAEGLKQARGEFVCLVDRTFNISPGYFENLYEIIEDHPTYRKLAMISPSTGLTSWQERIYGYKYDNNAVVAQKKPSSLSPYPIQIGYMPGSLIRRSALGWLDLDANTKNESIEYSLRFWDRGLRLIMDPRSTYYSFTPDLDQTHYLSEDHRLEVDRLKSMFEKEFI